MTPKKILVLGIMASIIASCSPAERSGTLPTDIEEPTRTRQIVDVKPTPNADLPFNETIFKQTMTQIHYTMPVTKSDILDESAIIIEGETGEFPDIAVIKRCLNEFTVADDDNYTPISAITKASDEYWSKYFRDASKNEEMATVANAAFVKCKLTDAATCAQSCETYSAISSVLAAPKANQKP